MAGFAADAPVFVDGALAGVQLRDVGIGKDGKEKDTFEAGRCPLVLLSVQLKGPS